MEAFVALATVVVLGVVWGVRQEGRITVLSQKVQDNDDSHEERVDSLKELIEVKFDGVVDRLARIERGMNGYVGGGGHGRT